MVCLSVHHHSVPARPCSADGLRVRESGREAVKCERASHYWAARNIPAGRSVVFARYWKVGAVAQWRRLLRVLDSGVAWKPARALSRKKRTEDRISAYLCAQGLCHACRSWSSMHRVGFYDGACNHQLSIELDANNG